MAATDLSRYHERTRKKGVNKAIFWAARAVLGLAIQFYFSLERTGRKNIPKKGAVILASTHRSFLDPFLIGCCLRRPVYFVAKKELFNKRWQGWILNCLGAFPLRRGDADEESMATGRGGLPRGRGVDGGGSRRSRARRRARDLPRGHAPPPWPARPSEARGGALGSGDRRP